MSLEVNGGMCRSLLRVRHGIEVEDPEEEVAIVAGRVEQLGTALDLPQPADPSAEIRRVVTVFRELRSGATEDGRTKLKSPSGALSTAEAISVTINALALAGHFGSGGVGAADIAAGLTGAVVRDPFGNAVVLRTPTD